MIAIAEQRDISDRNAIKINRARDSDAMIAIAAKLWRSQRDDHDRDAILKNRICDLRARIAILSMKSRSQRHCTYRGVSQRDLVKSHP